MRRLTILALSLLPWSAAIGGDGEPGFRISAGAQEMRGPGPQDFGSDFQILPLAQRGEVSRGTASRLALAYVAEGSWFAALEHERARVRYADLQVEGCELAVGFVSNIILCQFGSSPRNRLIEDRTREWKLLIGHRASLGDQLSVVAELGYGVLRWGSDDDLEVATFSDCRLFAVPAGARIVDGCVPISDRSQAAGWTAGLRARMQATKRLGLEAGAHWQGYRYDIYRFTALERFMDAARRPCAPFDWCDAGDGRRLARAPARGDWWWYTARIDWNLGEHWTLGVDGAWGGSRDWETLGASIAYRW